MNYEAPRDIDRYSPEVAYGMGRNDERAEIIAKLVDFSTNKPKFPCDVCTDKQRCNYPGCDRFRAWWQESFEETK